MDNQAIQLNETIQNASKGVYSLLSVKGKEIFFPKQGVVMQAAQAKQKSINATIGEAKSEEGSPLYLESLKSYVQLDPKEIFPYASSFGLAELRKKWKELLFTKNPSLDRNNLGLPIVTAGVTHGIYTAAYMFADEGDSVIIPSPYWENYDLIFDKGFNTRIENFPLFLDNNFNIEGLREIMDKPGDKKILILNFPNNPTGYTPSLDEAKEIVSTIKEFASKGKKILVILDDAYFGLFYENSINESLISLLSQVDENVLIVKLDGLTKEEYAWGLRIGFLTFSIKSGSKELYDSLESKSAGVVRLNVSNASHLSQSLALKTFSSITYWDEKKNKFDILNSKYLEAKKALSIEKYEDFFSPFPFNSGYFLCLELKKGIDSESVRQVLLDKYDIGVISLPGMIRIAFSSIKKEKFSILFDSIYNACKEVMESKI